MVATQSCFTTSLMVAASSVPSLDTLDPYLQQIERAGSGGPTQQGLQPLSTQPPQIQITPPQFDPQTAGSNYEQMGAVGGDWRTDFGGRFGLKQTSGDRDAAHNKAVNGVANSYHLKPGWAADYTGTAQQMAAAAAWAHTRGAREVLIHNAGSGQHLHVVFDPSSYGTRQVTGVAPTGAGKFSPQQLGLSAAEWMIMRPESGGNTYAQNPRSSAFGLGQLILSNRKKYLGRDYATTDARKQLMAFRSYIRDRYGSAEAAVAFRRTHGWY